MIKNIILDIGGVIFDDSKNNTDKVLNKNSYNIYQKAYGGNFKKCLLGEMTINEHIKTFENDSDYQDIKYVLSYENLNVNLPLIKDNFAYIKELKKKGYKLFILSNMTYESHLYIKNTIDIDKTFDGGIYSYQENIKKPDPRIYELLIDRYNLNKEETIFFDDKEKNVISANSLGIKSFVFKSIDDIKNNL